LWMKKCGWGAYVLYRNAGPRRLMMLMMMLLVTF
jgi:hypothetical protein